VAADVGIKPIEAHSAKSAVAVLQQQSIDILLVDLSLPGLSDAELLKTALDCQPQISIVLLTQRPLGFENPTPDRADSTDFAKPIRIEQLREEFECIVRRLKGPGHDGLLDDRTRAAFGDIVGGSEQMNCIYRTIEKVAPQNHSVLVLGESGTGKELVAREIHRRGAQKGGVFVPVDCSAITPSLIESELFGHVRGAFTGAMQSRQGLLEAANGGTLFLDEIGEMPLEMQAKLLRATQEREIKPVGTNQRRPIDVRIIAATNRDLEAAIKHGTFRQDLFFRLNVIQIHLPALREHKSDILGLIALFLKQSAPREAPVPTFSATAMRTLMAYDWPGNIRELQNVIARGVACSSGDVINVADLPTNLPELLFASAAKEDSNLPLIEVERRAILHVLSNTSGDKLAASRILGIGKTTLYRKLKQYAVANIDVN
jgi:two-component system response regulator HydG